VCVLRGSSRLWALMAQHQQQEWRLTALKAKVCVGCFILVLGLKSPQLVGGQPYEPGAFAPWAVACWSGAVALVCCYLLLTVICQSVCLPACLRAAAPS
jgi:hypothetical protein